MIFNPHLILPQRVYDKQDFERKHIMPKVNLGANLRRNAPPIDWLWAAVLERKMRFGYDLKALAKVAGVEYDTMRRYITISPWEWTEDARNRVCNELGIQPVKTVRFAPPEDWGLAK